MRKEKEHNAFIILKSNMAENSMRKCVFWPDAA